MAAGDEALVRIHDLAGRPRGTGFVADHHGTVITSHEAVDGLPRLVLHAAGDRTCLVTADAVTPLPDLDLALVRTEGLDVEPLPVTARDRVAAGTYVRIPAGRWREARVLGGTSVTYAATDSFHLLDDALELAIGTAGRDALRPGCGAAGGPVLDTETGAVLAVLGTALQSGRRDGGFAVPLRPAPPGPLADLLAENAATVPAYGADLNLAGVLELTATSMAQDGPAPAPVEPVQRAATAQEFAAFTQSPAAVLGLVGAPGSGRTTELASLAARRGQAPTLWLRGADLADDDTSIADAAHRALTRAARIIAASRSTRVPNPGDITPDRLAQAAHTANRPLLLLLDGPEEMPPALSHRLPNWTEGTGSWLRETGVRMVVACREEYWEALPACPAFEDEALSGPKGVRGGAPERGAGDAVPAGVQGQRPWWGREGEAPGDGTGRGGGGGSIDQRLRRGLCVRLGDLHEDEAREARARYRIPEDALADTDTRHPLTLRLLAELRSALPDTPHPRLDRHEVFSAHLDLMCLRIAVRLAAENGLRGTAVRRLAAKVSGQVHEAARRSLGPGEGELDRETFEAVFPWGPAPERLGGTGWASAVLTEGLLIPAGSGYRFAHEELADWLQGMHLDLDEALRALVHHRPTPDGDDTPLPVPHHRIGPVVQALLLLARQQGPAQLALQLEELAHALDADPQSWWAARLIAETLRRVPDATPYLPVLHTLADRLVTARRHGCPEAEAPQSVTTFTPAFWTALPLPLPERLDLLRHLLPADGPRQETGPRFLDAASRLLAADPTAVQPLLTRWFEDDRPLPATPHATVAKAAQALLHTHRRLALDELTEALVECAHRRADELFAVLAEDEPSAVCRAVDRWAHDERAARRAAAVTHGLRAAPHVRTEADRELLRYAALALLARPADSALHGGALALLVRDPRTRARHLPQALRHFTAGDERFPPSALVPALITHPDAVLDAFRDRLHGPDPGAALRTLADVTTAPLARRAAALVRETVEQRPETAEDAAAYVDRCLDRGPAARALLLPLTTALLKTGPTTVRAALAAALTAPGTPASRPLRRELLDHLLAHEQDPAALGTLLHTAAHRTGLRAG